MITKATRLSATHHIARVRAASLETENKRQGGQEERSVNSQVYHTLLRFNHDEFHAGMGREYSCRSNKSRDTGANNRDVVFTRGHPEKILITDFSLMINQLYFHSYNNTNNINN